MIQALDGWFWRRVAWATLAVSPECERQVREVAGRPRGPINQIRAQYRKGYFESLAPPPPHSEKPFHVLYAGRIERAKGVFDLLAVAEKLERQRPGAFAWEVCGEGKDAERLAQAAAEKGLSKVFALRGRLGQSGMADAFARSHIVVVPTNSAGNFAEGLNKVAVEGALAGRPVVTSRLSNAIEVLGDAVLEVPPDDLGAYTDAFVRLADDPDLYARKAAACRVVRDQFYDESHSFGQAVRGLFKRLRFELLGSGTEGADAGTGGVTRNAMAVGPVGPVDAAQRRGA
jgi:glycosyltransferase involved in cell wall biosynthesis